MGYETLSMSASSLLRVKWVLRKIGMDAAKELLEQVWKMDNAAVICSHVDLMLDRAGLGSFIRPTLFQGSNKS
jgi:phosphotransferase system enzyme I (PtsP)